MTLLTPYYADATTTIYLGDCREIAPKVSCDCDSVVTSPPYGVGKEYEVGGYSSWVALMFTLFPALLVRPQAMLALVIADIRCHPDPLLPAVRASVGARRQRPTTEDIISAIRDGRAGNKSELTALLGCSEQTIDRRLQGNNARGSKQEHQTRIRLSGADIERAAMAAGFYLYDNRIWVKDPCWETCQYHAISYRSVDEYEHIMIFARAGVALEVDRSRLPAEDWAKWGSRGVWTIPSVRSNTAHPAMFPLELARRLVAMLTPTGGCRALRSDNHLPANLPEMPRWA